MRCDTEVSNGMQTNLMCRCGHCISRKDVTQRKVMNHFRPGYVYIRYRCSRCKMLGEFYIRQDEWSDELLLAGDGEVNVAERKRFARLGVITFKEMHQFHSELENLTALPLQPHEE